MIEREGNRIFQFQFVFSLLAVLCVLLMCSQAMAADTLPTPSIPNPAYEQKTETKQLPNNPRISVSGALTFSALDTVANRGISASYTVSGTPITPNSGVYELNITNDTASTKTYFNGLTLNYLNMGVNGGGRAGLAVQFSVTKTPALSVQDANYVGISPNGYANSNVGGTPDAAAGNLTANNPNIRLAQGATYWGAVNGQETDAGLLAGSSSRIFYGQSIVHNSGSAVNGSLDDAGLSFNDQDDVTARWQTGIGFGSHSAQWPIAPTGTIIGAIARTVGPLAAPVQALNGIDFRAVTFQPGGHSLAVPGFNVDPSGNANARSVNTPILTSTGSIVGVSLITGGHYAANVFPVVTVEAPTRGERATAAVSGMTWSGRNTTGKTSFIDNGIGCAVGDQLYGSGASGVTFSMNVTSIRADGAVTGYVPNSAGAISAPFSSEKITMAGGTCTKSPVFAASFYVTNIAILSGGSGYITSPNITFSAGLNDKHAMALAITNATQTLSAGTGKIALTSAGTALGLSGTAGQPILMAGATADQAYVRIVAVSGSSARFENNVSEHFLDPVAGISSYADTLPASPADGQIADISCGQTIMTLTVNAAPGQTLRPNSTSVRTSCSATQGHRWKYRGPQTTWNQIY